MIAINGRFTTRRITGVERYAHEISKRLTAPARIIQPNHPLGQIAGHLWEQFVLPTQLLNGDVLWSPANAGAWSVRNQVITIHDTSVFDHPEWFRPSFAAWTRLSWKILAKRVKAVITVSNFSRERIIFHLQIPEDKIHVIPNGVGRPFEVQTKVKIDETRKKYDLGKPYFLFVGTHQPGKNLAGLFEAFEKLRTPTHILVIAGGKGKVFAEAGQIGNLTRNLGYVPDSDLPALYSGASAVLTTSLYEGSGLTALEAMACGAPVIASHTTSFPEVVGDAALLVNPDHIEEITNAMQRIITDPYLTDSMRERGLQRAAEFTWDKSARKTQSLLENIL